VDYEVVQEGEEPHEELDLKDQPHWEVVEESSLPFLHFSEQAFNTAHRMFHELRPRALGLQDTMPVDEDNLFVHASNTLLRKASALIPPP